jgi:lipopolysaccharide transport system permease protein
MFALGIYFRIWPSWHVVAYPVVLAIQILFTLALAYFVSALNVRFRDLQHILGTILTLWFFVTPILYASAHIPERFREPFILCNPMAAVVTSYQSIFYDHRLPAGQPLALVGLESLVLLWLAALVFDRRREDFAELI